MKRIYFKRLKGKPNPDPYNMCMDIYDNCLVRNQDGSYEVICQNKVGFKEISGFFRRYILMTTECDEVNLTVHIPAGYILSVTKTQIPQLIPNLCPSNKLKKRFTITKEL